MLDRHLHPRLKPVLNAAAALLDRPAISPDGLTLFGFAIGVLALPFLALGWYPAALAAIVLNRLLDGLDGALARRRGLTDAGGFLDISLDFLFYALVPFGFILADPAHNALAGGWLLFAFIGTGSSFLGLRPQIVLLSRRADGRDGNYRAICAELPVSGVVCVAGVDVWRTVLADDLYAGVERIPYPEAGKRLMGGFFPARAALSRATGPQSSAVRCASAVFGKCAGKDASRRCIWPTGELHTAFRAAFPARDRVFRVAAPLVPAAVVDRDVVPAHRPGVHKGF